MRIWHVVLAAVFTMSSGIALAQTAGGKAGAAAGPTIVTMDTTKWTTGTGMLKGTDVAVLYGDPTKPGPYGIRLKIPANTTFAPHYHGDTENVTVISGTLYVGVGDKVNPSSLKALGPGSFVSVPANLHHYALTKDAAVIQIEGIGPSSMNAVAM